jgi:signal transduction histidine kinase
MGKMPPEKDEMSRLLHDLREPLGAFVIYLALLDDEKLSDDGRKHLESMLGSVQRMVTAVGEIASSFGLEPGKSTPLAILNQDRH